MKLVRWVSEILSDGSEIRSLSGRSAKLGDGFSRNPRDRDELQQLRTKDLEGLAGQLRGFDMDEYETEEAGLPIPWGVGNDAVPESRGEGSTSSAHADRGVYRGEGLSSEPRADPTGIVGVLAAATGMQERVVILAVADYAQHLRCTRLSVSLCLGGPSVFGRSVGRLKMTPGSSPMWMGRQGS